MQTITKDMIKGLREKSGAGLADCKNALRETSGDIDEAVKSLREKGLALAAKKSSRAASDGKIGIAISDDNKFATMVEVNCETDFVTKTDDFQNIVNTLSALSMQKKCQSLEQLNELSDPVTDNVPVNGWISQKIAVIGENIVLRRFQAISAGGGETLSTYVHGGGKIGVLIRVATSNSPTQGNSVFQELLKDVGMHIAAAAPQYLDSSEVDPAELEKEREIYRKQMLDQGKPENIVDKIVDGKIKKYYEEVCLLDQEHVKENKVKVKEVIRKVSKEVGDDISIKQFIRFALGS